MHTSSTKFQTNVYRAYYPFPLSGIEQANKPSSNVMRALKSGMVMVSSSAKKMVVGNLKATRTSHNAKRKLVSIQIAAFLSLRMEVWKSMVTNKVLTVGTSLDLWLFIIAMKDLFFCHSQLTRESAGKANGKELFHLVVS